MGKIELKQMYEAFGAAVHEAMIDQQWWPCLQCPVAKIKDQNADSNCCHHSMFLITKTEWEVLKESPFIQENWKRLTKAARKAVHKLRGSGYDTNDWPSIVQKFVDEEKLWTCPFLDEDSGLCQVYDKRPTICRTFGVTEQEPGTLYGCRVVTRVVTEHGGGALIPLGEVTAVLREVAEGPVKPITGWLSEER